MCMKLNYMLIFQYYEEATAEYQTKLNALSICITFNPRELDLAAVAWCNGESFYFSVIPILYSTFKGEKLDTFRWNSFL